MGCIVTDKELRHLSRSELLEMLITQTEENETLRRELETTKAALSDRQIAIANAGSIAEAALKLNGVFDAAQAAAQQYLENLQAMTEQQNSAAQALQAEAEAKANAILAEADAYSKKTHSEADAYWSQISNRVQTLLQEHDNLQDIIQGGRGSKQ